MRKILIVGLFALAGCSSATLVQANYEPTKGGVVKYKGNGVGNSARRREAEGVMADFCEPQGFKVLAAQSNSESRGYHVTPANQYYGADVVEMKRNYVYTKFRCEGSPTVKKSVESESEVGYQDNPTAPSPASPEF